MVLGMKPAHLIGKQREQGPDVQGSEGTEDEEESEVGAEQSEDEGQEEPGGFTAVRFHEQTRPR